MFLYYIYSNNDAIQSYGYGLQCIFLFFDFKITIYPFILLFQQSDCSRVNVT